MFLSLLVTRGTCATRSDAQTTMLIQVHFRTRGGGDSAHEERCGVVAQYEYKLYRCARYELGGLAHEERCGWLSTSFADVRMCGWLTKSNVELAQSRTTSDLGRQLPAPEPQDAPGNLVGALGQYVEGRSLVVVGGRRATLSHERAKDQEFLFDVARVGPFGRADAGDQTLDLGELTRICPFPGNVTIVDAQELFGRQRAEDDAALVVLRGGRTALVAPNVDRVQLGAPAQQSSDQFIAAVARSSN